MGDPQFPAANAFWPPNRGQGFMPPQTVGSFLAQFPPTTPPHIQLASLYQSQRMLLGQKEGYENQLKITNENLVILQNRIQELENSKELPISVVMQKAFEAFNSGEATEEMKAAFEALKKAVQ
jgi:hypothetical protein